MIPHHTPPAESRGLGIALVLGSSFIFALGDAASKMMVATLPPLEVQWIRAVIVALIAVPIAYWRKGKAAFVTTHPGTQLVRGAAVWISSLLYITGLSYLPLADTTAINFIWPILITVFSVFMLGEKVGIRRAIATLVGFVGMLIIIRPGSSAFQITALLPIGAAILWAFGSVMTRGMMTTEPPETTMVWSSLVMLVGTTLLLPFYFVMPGWREIGLGLWIGLSAAVGHTMVIVAFGRARASVLAPFAYVQLVWEASTGYLLFGTVPDRWIVAGAAIIVASGLYTLHREGVRRGED